MVLKLLAVLSLELSLDEFLYCSVHQRVLAPCRHSHWPTVYWGWVVFAMNKDLLLDVRGEQWFLVGAGRYSLLMIGSHVHLSHVCDDFRIILDVLLGLISYGRVAQAIFYPTIDRIHLFGGCIRLFSILSEWIFLSCLLIKRAHSLLVIHRCSDIVLSLGALFKMVEELELLGWDGRLQRRVF